MGIESIRVEFLGNMDFETRLDVKPFMWIQNPLFIQRMDFLEMQHHHVSTRSRSGYKTGEGPLSAKGYPGKGNHYKYL